MTQSDGQLTYSKPDKGSFFIKKIHRWEAEDPKNTAKDAPGKWVEQKSEIGEHWVCDGKAIYEYVQRAKELRVQPIPKEMRGEAIVNGPLPFLFGAKRTTCNGATGFVPSNPTLKRFGWKPTPAGRQTRRTTAWSM